MALLGLFGIAAASALRPSLGAPLVALTLPFYLHPRVFGGLEVSIAEATILASAAGVVVYVLAARLPAIRTRGGTGLVGMPQASLADWFAAMFLFAALVSLLVTEYPRQSLRELRWLIIEPLLVFYVARATLRTRFDLRLVLWTVVTTGVIASLIGVGSLLVQGTLFTLANRATDPYLSPNHLGLFLGRAAAVAFALALFARGGGARRERTWAWPGVAITSLCLLRTISLGGWAGLGATALVLTALKGRRWLAVSVAAGALVVVLAVVGLPTSRTTGRLDPGTGTALFRLQIWTSSLHMISDHPLLGIGLDNFLYLYRGGYMLPEASDEPNISHPHNWLLHFWLELGLLGVLAAIALVIWGARKAWHLARQPRAPDDRLIGATVIGVFADTLVHGSLDNSYFLLDAAVIWWLFVALLVVQLQIRPSAEEASEVGEVEFGS